MSFHTRLNYSLGNETWQAESYALAMKAGDRALCVTGSGDRPLHLLLGDAGGVVSIDTNCIQNYLLELKMVAIRYLDYVEFLEFMGIRPSAHRIENFCRIQHGLSQKAREFWVEHPGMIQKGVVFQGKTERYCLFVSRLLKILFGRRTRQLLAFDCIEEQARFVEQEWDGAFHRWLYKASICMPKLPRVSVFDDPGLHAYVDASIDPGWYMYERKNAYLRQGLANKSLLLQLLYHGELLEKGFPAYLREQNYACLKSRIDRIEVVTGDVAASLQTSDRSFDVFSLSDIASYMPYQKFVETLYLVKKRAIPGSRFSIREYMTRYGIPDSLAANFVRDRERESLAEASEANFVYRIMAGHIV